VSPAIKRSAPVQEKAKRKQEDETVRKRKKAKHEHTEKDQEPEEEDEVVKKHKGVLSKYQRSSQIAEAVHETSQPAVTEEDQQPTPELHGESLNLTKSQFYSYSMANCLT